MAQVIGTDGVGGGVSGNGQLGIVTTEALPLINEINEIAGVISDAFKDIQKNCVDRIRIYWFTDEAVTFGDKFAPACNELLNKIKKSINSIIEVLNDANKVWISKGGETYTPVVSNLIAPDIDSGGFKAKRESDGFIGIDKPAGFVAASTSYKNDVAAIKEEASKLGEKVTKYKNAYNPDTVETLEESVKIVADALEDANDALGKATDEFLYQAHEQLELLNTRNKEAFSVKEYTK